MPSKNIPVNGWPQIKELDIVAPILAELDKIEAWQKSVKQETKTGAEVTFTNALALPALSLSADIEPIQDLHGQSAPYVGGAGKNKLPMTVSGIKAANTVGTWSGNSYTVNNMTIDIVTDDADNVIAFKVNGTNSGAEFVFSIPFGGITVGNYYANGCADGGSESNFDVYFWNNTAGARVKRWDGSTGSVSLYNSTTSAEIQVPNTTDNLIYNIRIRVGYTANNVMFYPMIRKSTESDPTFAPYSNICPISGHTSVTITRTDAESQTADFTIQLGQTVYGGSLNLTTGVMTIDHAIVDMGTMEWTAQTTNTENIYRMNSKSIKSAIDYPDSFTVLGGLICEWYADKTARETYQKNAGVSVDNVGEIFVYDENYNTSSSATAFTTFISGCHLCYKLKTPITAQLTPTQLEMLKGYNQISSDGGGDITVTAYTGNTWN